MKPAFRISNVRGPSYCSPGGIRQQRLGDRRSDRRIVNGSACDSRTPMNSQAKDRDALAAATRSDVNGLKRLPERPLLQQIRRSRTHIEMTGVRFGNQGGSRRLRGGAEGIRTSDLRDKARGVGRRFQGLKLPKRRLRISLETSGVSLDLRAASSSKASPVSMRTAGLPVATWYRRTITST